MIEPLNGQFGAALAMLRSCVERADEPAWHATVGRFAYWHIVYHVLHSTDLYLSRDEASFRPQTFHREGYELLGAPFWDPETVVEIDLPYERAVLKDYVDWCGAKAKQTLVGETEASLSGASGFSWLEFSRLELHLYNLRHIQHHTGQLIASLRQTRGDTVEWRFSDPL